MLRAAVGDRRERGEGPTRSGEGLRKRGRFSTAAREKGDLVLRPERCRPWHLAEAGLEVLALFTALDLAVRTSVTFLGAARWVVRLLGARSTAERHRRVAWRRGWASAPWRAGSGSRQPVKAGTTRMPRAGAMVFDVAAVVEVVEVVEVVTGVAPQGFVARLTISWFTDA
jgi:hypothetical protein